MKVKFYEYTEDEKVFIKNKIKNYKRLFDRFVEMTNYLSELAYIQWSREELLPLANRAEDQVSGMSDMIKHLESCFADQSLSVCEYDDNLKADLKMVKQIREMIDYYKSKPSKIHFRYR